MLFGSGHLMPELVELPEYCRNKFHQFRQWVWWWNSPYVIGGSHHHHHSADTALEKSPHSGIETDESGDHDPPESSVPPSWSFCQLHILSSSKQ